MLNPNALLKYFGLFWVFFALFQFLVATTPVRNGLSGIHASLFGRTSQAFLPEIKLQAVAKPESGEIHYSFFVHKEAEQKAMEQRKTGRAGNVQVTKYDYVSNPRFHVNTALVFLLALFLATPLPWAKRLVLGAVGAVLFYLYTLLRVTVNLKEEIRRMGIGLYESNPDSFFSLPKMANFLGALGFIFMLAILIWALLVFTGKGPAQMRHYLK